MIYFNSCCVRHQNSTFCLGQSIVLSKHDTFPEISAIDITKDSFSHCQSSSLVTLCNTLESLLSESNKVIVVLGNLNINILTSTNINLQHVLSNYTLPGNRATDISGSLIDHVYANNETKIVSIYFSDYGTVKFRLNKKY